MGTWSLLQAADGHRFESYVAAPKGPAKGAIVVVQEIFGVTSHIERVADTFAARGFYATAPAFFDRIEKSMRLGYGQIAEGRAAVGKLSLENVQADLEATVAAARAHGKVAVTGYCWGGAMAYLAAAKVSDVSCAIDYYGTRTIELCERMKPRVPVMYHFGLLDKSLPREAIDKIKAADPNGVYHLYEGADHGFNCDERPQYNVAAANIALTRSLAFLAAQL
jgi:carboxymethylenebutenolidase